MTPRPASPAPDLEGHLEELTASELHRGIAQSLTAAALLSDLLVDEVGRTHHEPASRVADLVRGAVVQVRALIGLLGPPQLGDGTLAGALTLLARNASQVFGADCRVVAGEAAGPEPAPRCSQLYRLARHAISAAVRTGGARRLELRIERTALAATLTITSDDPISWVGLPAGALSRTVLERRGHAFALQIATLPGAGTQVTCSWPIVNGAPVRRRPASRRRGSRARARS